MQLRRVVLLLAVAAICLQQGRLTEAAAGFSRIYEGFAKDSETVGVGPAGNLWFVTKDLKVYRADANPTLSSTPTQVAVAGLSEATELLGLEMTPQGHMIACDVQNGLVAISNLLPSLRVPKAPKYSVLANSYTDGNPLVFCDDMSVAPDGMIYFSDVGIEVPCDENGCNPFAPFFQEWAVSVVGGGQASGKLSSYDPITGDTVVLLDGLKGANGVALSKDGSFVLIAETLAFSIRRYWLKGPKAGTSDVFNGDLPGAPDGVSLASDGNFWVATPAEKVNPPFTNPLPVVPIGRILKLNAETGEVMQVIESTGCGEQWCLGTAVTEYKGKLYIGTLAFAEPFYIGVIDLAAQPVV